MGVSEGTSQAGCEAGEKRMRGQLCQAARTFAEPIDLFAESCGFPRNNERKLGRMLLFRDVYKD